MEANGYDGQWIAVDESLVNKVSLAIEAALAYEAATGGTRRLGITGEVGEILGCYQLGLRLMLDSRSMGFDAVDSSGKRVQVKTRRSESGDAPRSAGRVTSFSKHPFDYALLVLLDPRYSISQIWRAEYDDLLPIIEKQKRRNPNLSQFKARAKKIYPAQ